MFEEILGNIQEDNGEMLLKIPGNVRKDSGKCSRRFRQIVDKISKIFEKIPGITDKYSGDCSRKFMKSCLFHETLFILYKSLQLNCDKTKE